MRIRVRVLSWLDRRGGVDVWFGGPGTAGRPDNAIDVVVDDRPSHVGTCVEGEWVAMWPKSFHAAAGKVLVIGIPEPRP